MRSILVVFAALAGCSGRPAPDDDQEWLTLVEFKKRAVPGTVLRKHPVVTLPAGAGVELRISRKPTWLVQNLDPLFFEALEPVDDEMVVVRLRARKTVHLDLEHLLASTDKESWMPLDFHFFPLSRESHVVIREAVGPEVAVPVQADLDQGSLRRDYAGFK